MSATLPSDCYSKASSSFTAEETRPSSTWPTTGWTDHHRLSETF
jgi:hypothetical protein